MGFKDMHEFAAAAREYVQLLVLLKKIGISIATLKKKQTAVLRDIRERMVASNETRAVLPDMSRLEFKNTKRTAPLRIGHVIVELESILPPSIAHVAWSNMQGAREVTEKDVLKFTAAK